MRISMNISYSKRIDQWIEDSPSKAVVYEELLEKQKNGDFRRTRTFYDLHQEGKLIDFTRMESMEFASTIDKILSSMNSFYGDNWEVYLSPTFSLHDQIPEYYTIHILILYPELTITSSSGGQHFCKDFIVEFTLLYNELAGEVSFSPPRGTKAKYSQEEALVSYTHSHISPHVLGLENIFKTQSFCLGNGTDIANMIIDFAEPEYTFEQEIFEMYLTLIDALVAWESIDGGPYIRMSSISTRTNVNRTLDPDNQIRFSIYTPQVFEIIRGWSASEPEKLGINFRLNGNKLIISNDETFENFLKEAILECNDVSRNTLYIKSGEYYFAYNTAPDTINQNRLDDSYAILGNGERCSLWFQGREVVYEIYESAENSEITDSVEGFKILPKFKKYVINELEKLLYEKRNRKSIIKRYYKDLYA